MKTRKQDLKVAITKVKKDVSHRQHWGKWGAVRKAVLELAENETIKVGPFEDKRLAYLCRNNAASGGIREQLKAQGFIAITEIEIENDLAFCYIQKIKPGVKTK